MKLNDAITDIQNSISSYINMNWKDIEEIIIKNKRQITGDFKSFEINEIISKTWGIYVFYFVSNSNIDHYENLKNLWDTDKSEKRLHCPAPIKHKFTRIDQKKEYCLYVGKSENLKGRIQQHVDQKTAFTTYGLKLSEHDRIHGDFTFYFSYYPLISDPKINLDAYKSILVSLEKEMRANKLPYIGKQ